MEGLGSTARLLERLTCLNHVHSRPVWGGYGSLRHKPRLLVAPDCAQVVRRRVRLDIGYLSVFEQHLNERANKLGS